MFKYLIPEEIKTEIAAEFAAKRAKALQGGEDPVFPVVQHVACRPHQGCPIRDGQPPTVETCFRTINLPNRFRPEPQNPTDRQLKDAVRAYFEYAGVPGYYESHS